MANLDTSAGNVALGQLSALPFENIIGGPLTASIKAQAMAAQTTVDFIRSVGLQEVDGKLEAINVEFSYQDGTGIFRRVSVPILTVIPIPFIVIDAVDIAFKARIAASAQQSSEESASEDFSASASVSAWGGGRWGGGQASFSASYSAKKDSKASQESKYSVEYTLDVHVHASQTGLPQGMAQILNILQDGITNQPAGSRINVFGLPQAITLSSAALTEEFTVLALDDTGEVGDFTLTVTLEPNNVLSLKAAPAAATNPVNLELQKATGLNLSDPLPEEVAITIKAAPTSGTGDPVTTTRTIALSKA